MADSVAGRDADGMTRDFPPVGITPVQSAAGGTQFAWTLCPGGFPLDGEIPLVMTGHSGGMAPV